MVFELPFLLQVNTTIPQNPPHQDSWKQTAADKHNAFIVNNIAIPFSTFVFLNVCFTILRKHLPIHSVIYSFMDKNNLSVVLLTLRTKSSQAFCFHLSLSSEFSVKRKISFHMTIQHHNYHNLDFLDQTLRKNKSFECKKLVRVTVEKTFPWAYLVAGRGGN